MPFTFRPRHRLVHANQFAAVYARKCRAARGPLAVFAARNELAHHRLGLSIGRRVGNAVERNRVKRMVRESFRQIHDALPVIGGKGIDLVVTAYPHEALEQREYQKILGDLVGMLALRLVRVPKKGEE